MATPSNVSEDLYQECKEGKHPPHLTAFVGFGCSYGGIYFGGYARQKLFPNYALGVKNSLERKLKTLQDVEFCCSDYRDLVFENCLVYCDPPYKGTRQYSTGYFDSEEFWRVVRKWSQSNTVIISEYSAPNDFKELWRRDTIGRMSSGKKVEKLFMYNDVNIAELKALNII